MPGPLARPRPLARNLDGKTRQPFRRCRLLVVQEPPERRQTGLHCLAESTADLPVTFYLSHTPSLQRLKYPADQARRRQPRR